MSICKQVLGMSMGVASFNKIEFGAVVTHYATHHVGLAPPPEGCSLLLHMGVLVSIRSQPQLLNSAWESSHRQHVNEEHVVCPNKTSLSKTGSRIWPGGRSLLSLGLDDLTTFISYPSMT